MSGLRHALAMKRRMLAVTALAACGVAFFTLGWLASRWSAPEAPGRPHLDESRDAGALEPVLLLDASIDLLPDASLRLAPPASPRP